LSKASFEESLENFLKAGLNGEKETTDGVSASIMLGKLPKTGTGLFDIKIDTDKLIKNHTMLMKEERKEEKKPEMKEERKEEKKPEMKEEKKEEIISIKSKKMKKVNSLCM
jgi:hypothetical protein